MIYRRNIAVAYALAIPIFLVALFVELGALYKLNAAEGDVIKAMSASHGFDALLGDVRELAGDVHRQVGAGVLPRETVVEPLEELLERGLERADLRDVHVRLPNRLLVIRFATPTERWVFIAFGSARFP